MIVVTGASLRVRSRPKCDVDGVTVEQQSGAIVLILAYKIQCCPVPALDRSCDPDHVMLSVWVRIADVKHCQPVGHVQRRHISRVVGGDRMLGTEALWPLGKLVLRTEEDIHSIIRNIYYWRGIYTAGELPQRDAIALQFILPNFIPGIGVQCVDHILRSRDEHDAGTTRFKGNILHIQRLGVDDARDADARYGRWGLCGGRSPAITAGICPPLFTHASRADLVWRECGFRKVRTRAGFIVVLRADIYVGAATTTEQRTENTEDNREICEISRHLLEYAQARSSKFHGPRKVSHVDDPNEDIAVAILTFLRIRWRPEAPTGD